MEVTAHECRCIVGNVSGSAKTAVKALEL